MSSTSRDDDLAYQEAILQGVSRTFALTIPQLPGPLREVVGNGYLLCRLADTIEDEPVIEPEEKRRLSERFVEVVAGGLSSQVFADELGPKLSPASTPAEHELVRNMPRVLRITHSFRETQRRALERCVRIMSRGMAEYQQNASLDGLKDQSELDRYCYYVAGVVGEMLTDLFCDYSPSIAARRDELMSLAVSFGQGLQMTNILKDVWEDQGREACWLPREVFERHQFDMPALSKTGPGPGFSEGMQELIAVARAHLANALEYTLLLPAGEAGIRRFCLWALGMAVLTLRKLNEHLDFREGQTVKISRRSVKATVLVTSAAAKYDRILRALFDHFTRSLPEKAVLRPGGTAGAIET